MTGRDDNKSADESPDGVGVTGALAAASEHDDAAGDPLGPLNRVTESSQDDDE
jgi:hypothetical protein